MPASSRRSVPAALLASLLTLTTLAAVVGATPAGAQGGTAAPRGSAPPGTVPAKPTSHPTPVFSARRVPAFLRARVADPGVVDAVTRALRGAPAATCATVSESGRTVFAHNPDLPVMPASTNKLLTAAALLDDLGPDAVLRTSTRAATAPGPDGTITGDLYLVGGGDPLLFTKGFRVTFKDQDQLGTDFAALADAVAAAGVRRITGNVVGDDTRHDAERGVATWPASYQKEDQVGALSALEVNRGISGLSKDPENPATRRVIGDPPLLGAETLASLLRSRGVTVDGTATAGVTPPGTVEVAGLDSLPVRRLVEEVLVESDNTASEVLTKELAVHAGQPGTTAAGTAATLANLREHALPIGGVAITDGSGLDRNNRVTCELLTALLDDEGLDSDLGRALPVSGRNGTLRTRFRQTPAEGRVAAKTGTLKDVSALAGFVTTTNGTRYSFSVIVNGELPPGTSTTKYEDDVVLALMDEPTGPALDVLGPLPPR